MPLATRPDACPEVSCLRGLLPRQVIAAAERRARQIGLGADRVLICGDAITEEAYLRALAASLGTTYEPVDHFSRADCPLDDEQLIRAAAVGLLPIREDGEIVWIIAPRNLTARNLAEGRQRALRPFRLTSSERLWRFVARYTQKTLGQRATEGLHRERPLLSNAPRPFTSKKAYTIAAIAFAVLAIFALYPIGGIQVLAAFCSAIFLGAATAIRYVPVLVAASTYCYADPSLNSPYGLAVDAAGNVWVTNESGASVTELSPVGAVLSGSTGFTGGVFWDRRASPSTGKGNAWIANAGGSSVVELGPTGSVLSGANGYTGGGIDAPVAIAVDSQTNVYAANFSGNSVTALTSTGSPYAASPLTDTGAIASPAGIAVDKSGYVWVSNSGANNLIFIQPSSGSFYYSQYTDNAIQGSAGIAVDPSNNKWVAASGINAISVFGGSTVSPVRSAGLKVPTGIIADGAGNLWITNGTASGSLAELNSSGTVLSPSTGFGSLNTPVSIGVDASGNVWTANLGENSVSEFVGIASPIATPIAATVGP